MRTGTQFLALIIGLFLVGGCNTKKAAEPEPVEVVKEVAEETPEKPEGETAAPEEHDMVISLEDIEKAAQAYALLHDDDLSMEDKRARFDKFLEENDWAIDAYADLMYDISQHSSARAHYLKKIAN